jgi:hypothetical protein
MEQCIKETQCNWMDFCVDFRWGYVAIFERIFEGFRGDFRRHFRRHFRGHFRGDGIYPVTLLVSQTNKQTNKREM